eukprot:Gb_12765 [translate_table: standard]
MPNFEAGTSYYKIELFCLRCKLFDPGQGYQGSRVQVQVQVQHFWKGVPGYGGVAIYIYNLRRGSPGCAGLGRGAHPRSGAMRLGAPRSTQGAPNPIPVHPGQGAPQVHAPRQLGSQTR